MELTEEFTVPVPADQLWDLLNDVERIAPLVPGFTLKEASHPDYKGRMKIKVGAIQVTYEATISFVERDDDAKRVVLSVKGKEVRGAGTVDATVTSTVTGEGDASKVQMVTDVKVTGRVAQFGRGIISDVSSRLTQQFVERLNAQLTAPPEPEPEVAAEPDAEAEAPPEPSTADTNGASAPAAAATTAPPKPAPAPAAPLPDDDDDEALDLGAVAAVPVLKRVAPVLAALGLLGLIIWLRGRRG